MSGNKFDTGKPRLELLAPSYWELCYPSKYISNWFYNGGPFRISTGYDPLPALNFGAEKYGDFNWYEGMEWSKFVGAFLRHSNKESTTLDGRSILWIARDYDDLDKESGLTHGSHAECCLMFLKEYQSNPKFDKFNDCPWHKKETQ